jgi:RNA polymerase sigma factor (sigma-70 family)
MEHNRQQPLSAADERRLSRRVERGDARAREEMVARNLGLVHSVAREYRGRGVALEDLVQEGTVGLVRAVDKFDPSRGLKFSTYAMWWIRRAVIDVIGGARAIRIPAEAGRGIAAVQAAEGDLRRRAAGHVTSESIAGRTGLSADRVETLRGAARVTASLDEPIGEDGSPLVETVADPGATDPWLQLDERETRSELWAMLRMLPKRHRYVLVRRYGLIDDAVQTHADIGAALGVGEERSRQLEREGLRRLRELSGEQAQAAQARRKRRRAGRTPTAAASAPSGGHGA